MRGPWGKPKGWGVSTPGVVGRPTLDTPPWMDTAQLTGLPLRASPIMELLWKGVTGGVVSWVTELQLSHSPAAEARIQSSLNYHLMAIGHTMVKFGSARLKGFNLNKTKQTQIGKVTWPTGFAHIKLVTGF